MTNCLKVHKYLIYLHLTWKTNIFNFKKTYNYEVLN